MFGRMTRSASRQDQPAWDESQFTQLIAELPGTAGLEQALLLRWRQLAQRFLADKQIIAPGGDSVPLQQALTIATLASWPMLNLGWPALSGWRELVLYPTGFRARRQHAEVLDNGLELVHEYDEEMAGEAGTGVVVLGWEEIVTDLEQPEDGINVVIHEIAHQFDATSGSIDGRPPLPAEISGEDWSEGLQRDYERLCARLDRDEETLVDPYAAKAPAEYFAVMLEHYCLRPDWLRAECPETNSLFVRLFGRIRDN